MRVDAFGREVVSELHAVFGRLLVIVVLAQRGRRRWAAALAMPSASVMPTDDDADGPRKTKKSRVPSLLCVDFVEDRMRTRLIMVFVAFAMYLGGIHWVVMLAGLAEYQYVS